MRKHEESGVERGFVSWKKFFDELVVMRSEEIHLRR